MISSSNDESGTFRAIYTTNIGDDVYVLHAFQKKSKRGSETPQKDLERIERRLKMAKELHAKK